MVISRAMLLRRPLGLDIDNDTPYTPVNESFILLESWDKQ